MKTIGRHCLIELDGCDPKKLASVTHIKRALRQAAAAADCHVIRVVVHAFSPHGTTGVALLEESHLAIHTWPELRYAAADLFCCGAAKPEMAARSLGKALGARKTRTKTLPRSCAKAPRRSLWSPLTHSA